MYRTEILQRSKKILTKKTNLSKLQINYVARETTQLPKKDNP